MDDALLMDQQIFEAVAVTRTSHSQGASVVTFAARDGRRLVLALTAAATTDLRDALGDAVGPEGRSATKLPQHFAVGSGRYEQVVLLRFEDDVPYGLKVADAAGLGLALIEEAEAIEARGAPARQ